MFEFSKQRRRVALGENLQVVYGFGRISVLYNHAAWETSKFHGKTYKKAAERTHNHREDGEEAVKRTGKVIPIDAGRGDESAEGRANVPRVEKPERK